MRAAIVLLERSSMVPKEVWRSSSYQRTLGPIEVAHLLANVWESNQQAASEKVSIVVPLEPNGSTNGPPSVHAIQGGQKDVIGVFDVSFVSADRVKVTLREEECARKLGSPKRRTRQIALLSPWKVVRVLLNGRFASYSGQHYLLREYHLALCDGRAPDRLEQPRLIDLQADLF